MYILVVRDEFSAAHHLPSVDGKCRRLHGHNWKVEVEVRAEELDDSGMAIDFHELKSRTSEILEDLDHRLLNDHPSFRGKHPTAENLARYIYERLARELPPDRVELFQVRVWESDSTAASYQARPCSGPAS